MKYGYIYTLKHKKLDLYKIGVTRSLASRMLSLKEGEITTIVGTLVSDRPFKAEKAIHKLLKKHRLPQSEWFEGSGVRGTNLINDETDLWLFDDIEDFSEVAEWMMFADHYRGAVANEIHD